jgi:hypothetical protein
MARNIRGFVFIQPEDLKKADGPKWHEQGAHHPSHPDHPQNHLSGGYGEHHESGEHKGYKYDIMGDAMGHKAAMIYHPNAESGAEEDPIGIVHHPRDTTASETSKRAHKWIDQHIDSIYKPKAVKKSEALDKAKEIVSKLKKK